MIETLDSQVALSLHAASTRDAKEWKLLWDCICSQLCVPIGIREGLEGEEEEGLKRGGKLKMGWGKSAEIDDIPPTAPQSPSNTSPPPTPPPPHFTLRTDVIPLAEIVRSRACVWVYCGLYLFVCWCGLFVVGGYLVWKDFPFVLLILVP